MANNKYTSNICFTLSQYVLDALHTSSSILQLTVCHMRIKYVSTTITVVLDVQIL